MRKKNPIEDLPLEVVQFPYIDGLRISKEAAYWLVEHVYYAAYDHGDDCLTVHYRSDGTLPPVAQKEDVQQGSGAVIPTPQFHTQEFHVPYAVAKKAAAKTQKQPRPIEFVDKTSGK